MYAHFNFGKGKNGYIATRNDTFFKVLCKYDVNQRGRVSFDVHGPRGHARKTYTQRKNLLRDFAVEWQCRAGDMGYSCGEMADWAGFFEEYGRKFGLLTEFRANAIV